MAHCLQHWASISLPVEWPYHDICSPNASLMLAHRLQPWLGSKTALAKRLIFAGRHRELDTLTQCYFNVGTVINDGTTFNQHWVSALCWPPGTSMT